MAKKKKTKRKPSVEIGEVDEADLDEGSTTVHYYGTVDVNVIYKGKKYVLAVKISADGSSYEGNPEQLTSVEVDEIDEIMTAEGEEEPEDEVFDEIERKINWKDLKKAIEAKIL